MWRNEKPGPGRFRQFTQFDADTVGTDNIAADAEICMLAADTMEALGIKRGDYVIKVSNRKVLDGVMEAIGLVADERASGWQYCARSTNSTGWVQRAFGHCLGPGRKDESGDFTQGSWSYDATKSTIVLVIQLPKSTYERQDEAGIGSSMQQKSERLQRILERAALPSLSRMRRIYDGRRI